MFTPDLSQINHRDYVVQFPIKGKQIKILLSERIGRLLNRFHNSFRNDIRNYSAKIPRFFRAGIMRNAPSLMVFCSNKNVFSCKVLPSKKVT